ncbi:MAG: RagB/SusD family nutrient uptake outer membrane protein [Dysgonamonadaceae bacterium]|nr:RagB/SusD family nutrient uptake outer membrane protein [Dysgonamonadaceae bacterium]
MKSTYKIAKIARIFPVFCCLMVACDYLDIIPPAQPEFEDTMKDEAATLDFLYTCYGYVPRSHPFEFHSFEQSADEIMAPKAFDIYQQQVAWGSISPAYYNSWGGDDQNIWTPSYNFLGYVHHFLSLIDVLQPVGVTDDMKTQYKAECYFLQAYYQFRVLQAFGPCPIIPEKVDPNITNIDIPGRSHFDYCVDYIVRKLDAAAEVLPPNRTSTQDLGRATSTIAKALKARVLLYAASPLWNGSFYKPEWKNENFETPGYGKELVSNVYSSEKWERALTACQEALTAAKAAGYVLFDIETANSKATLDGVELLFVPGREDDTEENRVFKQRVRMFQYLLAANEGSGNKEIIWGQRISTDGNNSGEATYSRLPALVVKKTDGTLWGGWASLAPSLYSVQHFYTENGKLPAQDADFYPENQWYTRFYEGTTSPEYTSTLEGESVKNDIIKLNAKREARFYAWIAFDGGEYAKKLNDGNPLWINFKNKNTNGRNPSVNPRNCVGTGYLSKKFIDPNIKFSASGVATFTATRRPFIRMAELYLNLAECYAALDNTDLALENLNEIRNRAGFDDLTSADITGEISLTDWVRNERYVELFEEGHRYYDVRRWKIAPEKLKASTRYGLNGFNVVNPSFEVFNTPTPVDQPFKWDDRLYLLPVWSRSGMDELYSNPQMVQAPGY